MKKPAHLSGCAGSEAHNQLKQNKSPPALAQHPRVRRAIAPPLHQHYSSDTVTAIIELVALHLRRTIPSLSDLTLNDFDVALADVRPLLRELIDAEIREALYSNARTRHRRQRPDRRQALVGKALPRSGRALPQAWLQRPPNPRRHDRVTRDDRLHWAALGDANAARSIQQEMNRKEANKN